MENLGPVVSSHGLDNYAIQPKRAYWNQSVAQLYEHSIRRGETVLTKDGPLLGTTGAHTGRSPNDKFIVRHPGVDDGIDWGDVNRPITPEQFDNLHRKMSAYIKDRDVFVFDGWAGADHRYRMPVRIVTEKAWHNIFVNNMFIDETDPAVLADFAPQFTVIDAPGCLADPETDGTSSSTFIVVNFEKRLVLIGGSAYAGEMKKSIFSVMNYRLPKEGVFSMHCSCNYGADHDDTALFFGLSGTGKTTLSSDPGRTLIGDDEHGWSNDGTFNIEGGCYAKVIRLSEEGEPEIYATTRMFGTILENVVCDTNSRALDLNDGSLTENTRASYPVTHLERVDLGGISGHPKHVIFLTCDAFGVLPPISRLTEDQAMYHFLLGYTAKVAGTERGVTEPTATFSACFGAPFLPLAPQVYAKLLGEKVTRHHSRVWLINTGWSGGGADSCDRIPLRYTRLMVDAVLSDRLNDVETEEDPFFGLAVPKAVVGVPREILMPRKAWADGEAYDRSAEKLAGMFRENFRPFEQGVSEGVRKAGPRR